MGCHGEVCFVFTKAPLQQLEIVHCESLRITTSLPRHTRVQYLYRYTRLLPVQAIIRESYDAHERRREATRPGHLVENLAYCHLDRLSAELLPVVAPLDTSLRGSKQLTLVDAQNITNKRVQPQPETPVFK